MQKVQLEIQPALPISEATKAALQVAREEEQRGETVSLEESTELVRKQYQAWRKVQQELLTP